MKRRALLAIAMLLIASAALLWTFWPRLPDTDPAPTSLTAFPLLEKASIAVLPFDNMSNDRNHEYFGDGISDDLITDLSKISDLLVISCLSSFTYKGKNLNARQIAEELGVRYVLEGSVRKAENHVRINAQLIDGNTGHHLWADRYDGDMGDIFALQEKIARRIASSLAVKLKRDGPDHFSRKDTDSLKAFEAYLKGAAIANSLRNDPDKFVESLSWFEKAIELDSTYSLAYAALAETYIFGSGFGIQNKLGISSRLARMRGMDYLQAAMKKPTNIAYRTAARIYTYQRKHEKASNCSIYLFTALFNEGRRRCIKGGSFFHSC